MLFSFIIQNDMLLLKPHTKWVKAWYCCLQQNSKMIVAYNGANCRTNTSTPPCWSCRSKEAGVQSISSVPQYHVMLPMQVTTVSMQMSHTADEEYISFVTYISRLTLAVMLSIPMMFVIIISTTSVSRYVTKASCSCIDADISHSWRRIHVVLHTSADWH